MTTTSTTSPKNKKQAVVVIHGMGEQRPMETIRSFVKNIWKKDSNLRSPHFWNKPSSVSESFEQRRLTTNSPIDNTTGKNVQRTDFYEYYWAHHTVNTKWEHFVGWISTLIVCFPSKYVDHPSTLKRLWYRLWGLLLLAGLSAILWWLGINWVNDKFEGCTAFFIGVGITIIEGIVLILLNKAKTFLTRYFGDVARYVMAKPANINIRQTVRKGGIELLERIHRTGDYDRVVLVGHSLGSIVAFDILNHLWARHNKFKSNSANHHQSTPLSSDAIAIINELEDMATLCGQVSFDQHCYREKQNALFNELKDNDPDNNWLISDFITLGSPLTYADILLFDDKKQFTERKLDREYPTSPPVPESSHWYYGDDGNQFLHHGAVFAPVTWTNISMPHNNFVKGDFISGRVSCQFSYKNISLEDATMLEPDNALYTPIKEVELDYREVKDGFTHSEYWRHSEIPEDHLYALREALRLY